MRGTRASLKRETHCMNRSLSEDMARFGNLAMRSQLQALGYSERDIRRAVDDHQLSPMRRRWLAYPGADWRASRAVALGGRLAAASALQAMEFGSRAHPVSGWAPFRGQVAYQRHARASIDSGCANTLGSAHETE